jgi:anthranilate synthase component 1
MQAALATPAPPTVAATRAVPPKRAQSRSGPGEYQRSVQLAIEAIRAGEVFQIVPGQRFEVDTDADPLDVYRMLRTLNPSPYMYYLHLDAVDIVGSSPEALVTVHGREATIHPIAGTRRRGETPERDAELVQEMVNDPKERAEHVMLVDLARNDLGRVCAPGSVTVVDFGVVERYSNVSHIVSTVTGQLADGVDAFDVFNSAFPHGTVTGAPKVRAMELLDELEPVRRGIYSGAIGYMDPTGDIDMAICFRTAIMRAGKAYVQAGAGVVADSDPALEERETENKARAVLQAIATAETLTPVRPVSAGVGIE